MAWKKCNDVRRKVRQIYGEMVDVRQRMGARRDVHVMCPRYNVEHSLRKSVNDLMFLS